MALDENILYLSKLISFRKDYNQSNGGNLSFKKDGSIFIKPSGKSLHSLNSEEDFFKGLESTFQELLKKATELKQKNISTDELMDQFMSQYNKNELRPSIETVLHSQLKKFTLHIHPIKTTALTCHIHWKEEFSKIIDNCIFLDYQHPGLELGLQLEKLLKEESIIPPVIIMQNHGIIFTANTSLELLRLTTSTLKKIDKYLPNELFNFEKYQIGEELFNCINKIDSSQKVIISDYHLSNHEINHKMLTPDTILHCGHKIHIIEEEDDILSNLEKIYKIEGHLPKVIYYHDTLFFVASSEAKARENEEVFTSHLYKLRCLSKKEINPLSKESIQRIQNWKAGKWRRI